MSKRSTEKRITRKAQVVRFMRQTRGLSLKQVGRLAGITGSAIAHMEGGRMDISDERLITLLRVYEYSQSEFEIMVACAKPPVSTFDECMSYVKSLDQDQLHAVHAILVQMDRLRTIRNDH